MESLCIVECFRCHYTTGVKVKTVKPLYSIFCCSPHTVQVYVTPAKKVHVKGKGSWICIAPHCEKLASEALGHGSHSLYTAKSPHLHLPPMRSLPSVTAAI